MNKIKESKNFRKRKINSFPSKSNREEFLANQIKELKLLCDEMDPYGEIGQEHLEKLSKLGISDLNDPFSLTNRLILMLEDSIEELELLSK